MFSLGLYRNLSLSPSPSRTEVASSSKMTGFALGCIHCFSLFPPPHSFTSVCTILNTKSTILAILYIHLI